MNNMGVIVKIEGNEAVIMTDLCTFEKVKKKKDMYIGQKILVNKNNFLRLGLEKLSHSILPLIGVVAMFLILISYYTISMSVEAFAYIDLDINPSFRISIDKNKRVTDVKPITEDGIKVISSGNYKGLELKDAIKLLLSITEAYIIEEQTSEKLVMITAAQREYGGSVEKDRGDFQRINNIIDEVNKELKNVYRSEYIFYTNIVPWNFIDKSKDKNISMGKEVIYTKLTNMGIAVDAEGLGSMKIKDILESSNIDLSTLDNIPIYKPLDNEKDWEQSLEPDAFVSLKTPGSNEKGADKEGDISNVDESNALSEELKGKEKESYQSDSTELLNKGTYSEKTNIANKSEANGYKTPAPNYNNIPLGNENSQVSSSKPYKEESRFSGTGLRGEYYENIDYTLFRFARVDSVIDFDWGDGSPDPKISSDSYAIRWAGKIEPRYTEKYTFYTTTDDGVRLWVDNKLIIDQWKSQQATQYSGKVELVYGKIYDIKMEYYDHSRSASARLMWSSKSQSKEVVPKECLYPSKDELPKVPDNGLKGEYFTGRGLKDTILERIDPFIDFKWKNNSLVKGEEEFSAKWQGVLQTRYSEDYTLHLIVRGGARVWVNGELIIDRWKDSGKEEELKGTIKLFAYRQYPLKIEYFGDSEGGIKLMWSSKRQSKQVIPQKGFFIY